MLELLGSILVFAGVAATPAPELQAGITRAFVATAAGGSQAPVVLTEEQLAHFSAEPISRIFLYAYLGSGIEPIPFQIDHRDGTGVFVLSDVHEKERVKEREKSWKARRAALLDQNISQEALDDAETKWKQPEDLTVLDEGDELVFMAWDAGDKAPQQALPAAHKLMEVEIKDDSGHASYAYIASQPENPKRSSLDYVAFDPAMQSVSAAFAEIDFLDEQPIIISSFRDRRSPEALSANLLDRFKLRLTIKPKAFFGIDFHESDVESKTIAYKDGPIRVIRRNLFWLEFLFIRVTPKAYVDYVFYPNSLSIPIVVHVPFDPDLLLRSGSQAEIGLDHTAAAIGTQMWSEHRDDIVTLDGKLSEEEKNILSGDYRWFALKRPWGSVMGVEIHVSKKMRSRGLTIDLAYRDDPKREAPPESHDGEYFVGVSADVLEIPPGEHTLSFHLRFAPDPTGRIPVGARPFSSKHTVTVRSP